MKLGEYEFPDNMHEVKLIIKCEDILNKKEAATKEILKLIEQIETAVFTIIPQRELRMKKFGRKAEIPVPALKFLEKVLLEYRTKLLAIPGIRPAYLRQNL